MLQQVEYGARSRGGDSGIGAGCAVAFAARGGVLILTEARSLMPRNCAGVEEWARGV